MTRGTETQETPQVPQEGRDQSEQIQEQDLEAQRDQEVIAEPEAVVERERPIEESEAIEAAVVEAIEAVTEDQGPGIADGELVAEFTEAMDETSYKVESHAEVGEEVLDEISYKTKPAEFTEAMDETSYKVESQAEVVEEIVEEILDDISYKTKPAEFTEAMDETSYKSESSTPESELKEGSEAEVSDVILESADFKFFTPQPDQILGESSILQEDLGAKVEAEVSGEILESTDFKPVPVHTEALEIESEVGEEKDQVILEGTDFKPVPAHLASEEVEHEDHWSESGGDEVENNPIPMPSPAAEGEAGEEDQGGSILIGEEGEELQEVDLTTEATKEVEEYWEPPEMYAYEDSEGNIIFVDAEGNPINSPPQYKVDPNDYSVQAWYQGGNKNEFNVKKFPGHSPDDIYAYHEPDGSITLVDGNGNMIPSPPQFKTNGNIAVKVDEGKGIYFQVIKDYNPPTDGIFAYTNPDGSIDIVDKEGNLVKSPPHFFQDGNDPAVYIKNDSGNPIKIPPLTLSQEDIYYYKEQDGSVTVVNKDGIPVKYPPHLLLDGNNEPLIKTDNFEEIPIKEYVPPLGGIFAYTAQDGSVYVVDKDGNQVYSPPHVDIEHTPMGAKFHTPDGSASGVEIPPYQPSIKDMFIHLNQEGSIDIVDKNGKMIESPPKITFAFDPTGKPIYMAMYAGMPVESSIQLNHYKPPSSN